MTEVGKNKFLTVAETTCLLKAQMDALTGSIAIHIYDLQGEHLGKVNLARQGAHQQLYAEAKIALPIRLQVVPA